MAWVTMISKAGSILSVPEPVYENMYKGNTAYSILEEPKPSPKLEKKQEEVVKDEPKQVQQPVINEVKSSGKSSKKTSS